MPDAQSPRAMSLRTRLSIVAGVFLLIMLCCVGTSALIVRSWSRALDERSEVRDATEDLAALRLAYSDQETGLRGYQLTHDESFLEPYDNGRRNSQSLLASLRDRQIEAAGYERQVAAVEVATTRWVSDVVQPVLDEGEGAADADTAQRQFDELRTELDQLEVVVGGRLDDLIEHSDAVRRTAIGVLAASAVVALGGSIVVAFLFRRWVTQPLAEISSRARELSTNDAVELPDFASSELQDVTDAIRTLQSSLAGARDQAVVAYAGLEQSAVLAVQVRAELADELGALPDGWLADSLLLPAEGLVAGDCFDMGLLDQHRVYLIVIDVAGHGAGSALDALKAKSQLRAALRSRLAPGAAIGWLAREAEIDDKVGMLTAAVAVVDISTGDCQFANAGHPPLLVADRNGIEAHGATGPLVGAFTSTWNTERFTIDPGATLIIHTDGVTDVVGANRERFGEERLRQLVVEAHVDDVPVTRRIREALTAFGKGLRADDITLVAIHRAEVDASVAADAPQVGTLQP